MEKTKLLTITVIGLLLLNFAILAFLLVSGPRGHKRPNERPEGRPDPREIIIERLHFDINQQKEYDKIVQLHEGQIKKLDENLRSAKNELYTQLKYPQADVKIKDSLIAVINANQKQIEETHFKHFEDIKKLCHQDQLEDFNALTEELSRIFAQNKPLRPRHD
jgi:Spy/CpxP family protein refolding chaperone